MPLTSGTRLGSYEIVGLIGAGGMGEVYRARDPRLGRDVAVKVLPAAFSNDPERMRRFEQEACATAALNHPNILAVYDIGTFEAQPYVVAELLGGAAPRWRHDGKEIFYATPAGRLMAAAVTAQGSTIEVGSVNPLSASPRTGSVTSTTSRRTDSAFWSTPSPKLPLHRSQWSSTGRRG